jgi:galactokinase
LVNSCVKHELASSAYNQRRQSCENVVAAMKKHWPEVESLRDADYDMLNAVKEEITDEEYLRAKYVIDEKYRVMEVSVALEEGDYETVGKKMFQTHHGLSKEYEVSCPELDFLNEVAKNCGVTGSRVMGGGFGGCTINLVSQDLYDNFIKTVKSSYNEKFGKEPIVIDVVIGDGSRKLC